MNLDEDTVDELPARPRYTIPEADRELLELAARALGAVRVEDVEGEEWLILHFENGAVAHGWNPAIHSDDTFNMAVDLQITLNSDASRTKDATAYHPDVGWFAEAHESHKDARAATRHAALRAAAELGKRS